MKRILLTGRNGQVGWELERALAPLGEVLALDRTRLDLSKPNQIREAIRSTAPDVIVNAAAYTAVDRAETEPDLAMAINGMAPGIMAEESTHLGALLVHYSTDYVFDGTKAAPYTEDDEPNPVNAYGRTKLAGEQAIKASGCRHLILRTSWVYGLRGHNFLRTIQRLVRERDELRVVNDQIGAPTWSRMLAEATSALLAGAEPHEGLFHLASRGETSWFGFAREIILLTGDGPRRPSLMPCRTSEYPVCASRPPNSRLDCHRLASLSGIALPDWAKALELCLAGN